MSKHPFKSILYSTEGLYKEKGSKFLSKAYPVQLEEEIKNLLALLKKEYFDARHICYAFSLQKSFLIDRANDDGEPAYSVGTPIFNQIKSFEISNVLVVVLRYFGGTKLGGGSGLIQAYKIATEDALSKTSIYTIEPKEQYQLIFPYEYIGLVTRWIKELNGCIKQENKTNNVN